MALIDFEFILRQQPDFGSLVRLGIETGTCTGASTRLMARRLREVISMELSPELAARTALKLERQGYRNVQVRTGDSPVLLRQYFEESPPSAAPILFFLDAHWSGDQSVDWRRVARGGFKGYGVDTAHRGRGGKPSSAEQNPLLEELAVIVEHCPGPAWILIDDMHLLPEQSRTGLRDRGFPGEDWSHLSRELLDSVVVPRCLRKAENRQPRFSQLWLELGPQAVT